MCCCLHCDYATFLNDIAVLVRLSEIRLNTTCEVHRLAFPRLLVLQFGAAFSSLAFSVPPYRVRSKLKVQNSSTFQGLSGPKLHFSSTKIIDKKPYPRRGHSNLDCNVTLKCTVLYSPIP